MSAHGEVSGSSPERKQVNAAEGEPSPPPADRRHPSVEGTIEGTSDAAVDAVWHPDGQWSVPLPPMSTRLAVHRFGPDDRAPGAARRFARSTLDEWGLPGLAETIELLVSEVVTNAVGHARSGGEMVITCLPDGLRVEVSDRGSGEVAPRVAGPEDVTGRGMAIVAALAARWGVHGENPDTGWFKTVWFEVDAAGGTHGSVSVATRRTL